MTLAGKRRLVILIAGLVGVTWVASFVTPITKIVGWNGADWEFGLRNGFLGVDNYPQIEFIHRRQEAKVKASQEAYQDLWKRFDEEMKIDLPLTPASTQEARRAVAFIDEHTRRLGGISREMIRIQIVTMPAISPVRYGIPWYLTFLLGTVPPFVFFVRNARKDLRKRRGLCPNCSYNLKRNESGTCPECGKPIEDRSSIMS